MAVGSYAIERDYSQYVAYAAKTVFAVVGTATKGPIGEAVVCTSAQDLVNKFGPLKPDCYALYAGQYFLSQSSKLYFVRAAGESASEATADLAGKSSSDSSITSALTVSLREKGTYGNGYVVVVEEGTTADTYKIILKNKLGTSLEVVDNISLDENLNGYESSLMKFSFSGTAASLDISIDNQVVSYTLSGGNDGIEDIKPADYIQAAKVLETDTVDMNLFAVPGVSDYEVVIAMLKMAEDRGDCLYLVDPPAGLTKEGVVDWHNGAGSYNHAALNSSYGALYYDWVRIYDSINKVHVEVPPSVPVSATIAYSDRVSEVWFAPAGLTRGLVSGVIESITKLSKGDIDHLYGDGNINVINDNPQVGLVLWGQKTLFREDSALNRINVRRLLNYLKRVVTAACDYLVFEPNDRTTWNRFEMRVLPVLESIKTRRGIYEYQIVRGENIVTNEDVDNYQMPCMIKVRPTKSAEYIPIYFVITSTGADFNEVLEDSNVVVTV